MKGVIRDGVEVSYSGFILSEGFLFFILKWYGEIFVDFWEEW